MFEQKYIVHNENLPLMLSYNDFVISLKAERVLKKWR